MIIKRRRALLTWCLSLAIAAISTGTAWATLGQSGDSVAVDRKVLSAASRATMSRARYSVHEIQAGSVTVREYISPSDVVFGLAWNGIVHPDLDQLLGSYAPEYKDALKKSRRNPGQRSSRQVKTDNVVVETWGHMRNLQGRAYVPALIPQGVDIDEIK